MKHVAHITAHTYIGIGTHTGVFPPAIPPVPTAPHIAVDTLLGLTLGANYSQSVVGPFGFQLVGKGNDSGGIVPHIAIAPHPGNILIPLIIFFGSSKPMFSASTVRVGNMTGGGATSGATPVAADPIPYNFVSFNQACNDPCNYPGDIVISPNTILVGLTLGDFIAGLARIAIDVAASYIANVAGGKVAGALMKHVGGRIAQQVLKEWTGEVVERFGKEAGEKMTREAVENILEGPTAQFVETLISKLAEGQIQGLIEGAENYYPQSEAGIDTADVYQRAIDGEPMRTSASDVGAPLASDHPGSPPIHNAE